MWFILIENFGRKEPQLVLQLAKQGSHESGWDCSYLHFISSSSPVYAVQKPDMKCKNKQKIHFILVNFYALR